MRVLRMEMAVYFPMEDKETQDQAEDRLLEAAEDAGIDIRSWTGSEILTEDDFTEIEKAGEAE